MPVPRVDDGESVPGFLGLRLIAVAVG